MDLQHLIGFPADGAVPEEIAPILAALLEGRLTQFAVVAETTEGNILTAFPTMDAEKVNRFAMLGGLEMLKRDFMRAHITSRIEYAERDEDC